MRRRTPIRAHLLRWASRLRLAFAGAGLIALLVFVGEARAQEPIATPGHSTVDARSAAVSALERWDVPGAREALAGLGAAQEPFDLLLRARLAHCAGEYAEALRLLGLLPPAAAAAATVAAEARLLAASLALDRRLVAIESEHFTVRFDPERDWVLAEPALAALEAGYQAIGGWLGERAPQKVRVDLVPSADDFAQVSGLAGPEIETTGTVGVSAFNRIILLSPRLLARGYPWRDALNHEYLHYLLVLRSATRGPAWLWEGIARYGEARWRTPDPVFLDDIDRSLVAQALRENALVPLSALESSLVRLSSRAEARLAFAESALAVDCLIGGWQVEGLRRVIAEVAGTAAYRGLDPVLRAAIGEPLARFEEGWRLMLEKRGYREVAGLAVPAFHLAGQAAADTWDLTEWQPLAAQNHLRLGDLLRARGNVRAGLMEYEKARAIAPASPYAQVKAARALLDLKQAPAAAAAAREAVRLGGGYPAANVVLAAALAALGDDEGAAAALRGALELNPFDPFAWRDLGRALRHLGLAQEAQQASVTALRLVPKNEAFMRSVMQDE